MDVTLIDTLKNRFRQRGNKDTGAALVTPVDADGNVIGAGSTVIQDIVIEGVASVTEQQAQSMLLNAIKVNTTGLVKHDKEVPFMSWKAIQAFTDVLVGDIIVTYGVLNTETLVLTTHTKRWRGALDVVIPGDINDYLVPLSGNPVSLAQMQSLGLLTQTDFGSKLGEAVASPSQYTLLNRVKSLEAVVGTPADTVATADTGTFSINALIKRGLARWTTLLSVLPAALGAGGGLKIDGSGIALQVSMSDAATGNKQDTGNGSLATIAGKDFATQATSTAILNKLIVAPATEAKQDVLANLQTVTQTETQVVTTSATSAQSAVVGGTTKRVILTATADMWVSIGSNPTAVNGGGSSFYLATGVPFYPIAVTAGVTKIAAIQATAAGKLSILESV